jgi:hypothetical protein
MGVHFPRNLQFIFRFIFGTWNVFVTKRNLCPSTRWSKEAKHSWWQMSLWPSYDQNKLSNHKLSTASVVDLATLDCLREDQDTATLDCLREDQEEPKNRQVQKWTSYPTDTWQNLRPKIHEKPKKKTWSTKGQSGEYVTNTWICAWVLADAKSLEMLENKRIDIPRIGCPTSSPSSRGVTRSCSGTPSGPRAHLSRPHQEL